jgi:purine-binding chemotaxis protein CheW
MEVIQEAGSGTHLMPKQTGPATAGTQGAPLQAPGEFLIFRLAGEEYGIDILRVQEIRSYEAPTLIAHAPDYIKGVINLRGIIVPILDLRLKFGLKSEYNNSTVFIVLNLKQRIVGVVVDAVSDVLALDSAHIRPVPQLGVAADTDFIIGMGSAMSEGRERMLILVDIEQLVSSTDSSLLDIGDMEQLALQ